MAKPCTQMVFLNVVIALHASCLALPNYVTSNDATVMPNVGYLLKGYNIFKGNPQSTSKAGVDVGFSYQQIYQSVVAGATTSDGRWQVPSNTTIERNYGCAIDFSSTVTFRKSDYQNTLKDSVSADFGGFGASFSASVDYQSFDEYTSTSKLKMVSSTAECVQYSGSIDQYTPPPFTANFLTAMKQLPADYGLGEDYFKLLDAFGTHTVTNVRMGARFGFTSYLDEETSKRIESTGVSVSVAAKVSGIVKVGGNVTSNSTKTAQEEFDKTTQHESFISLGAKPTSENATEWANQVIQEPMPVRYSLKNICEVFNDDVQKAANCHRAQGEYCQKFLKMANCNAPADGDLACFWDDDCGQGQQCVDYKCATAPKPPKDIAPSDKVHLYNVDAQVYFKDVRAAGVRKGWPHGRLGEPKGEFQLIFENAGSPIHVSGLGSLLRIRSETTTAPGYDFMYASSEGGIYFDQDTADNDKQWWKITKIGGTPGDDDILRDGDIVYFENKYQPNTYLQKYEYDWVYSLPNKNAWRIEISKSANMAAAYSSAFVV